MRARGGQDRTVHGLAGIGDLMLTCTGQQSRNRFVGEQVGRGRRLAEVLVEMPEVAEGARTCLAVPRMAAAAGVEAPIADAVVQVLYENVPPRGGGGTSHDAGAPAGVARARPGTRRLLRFFSCSSTRIGSTIACRPANCSRRWIANAVSLCRNR